MIPSQGQALGFRCSHRFADSLAAALWHSIFRAKRDTNALFLFLNTFYQVFPKLHFSDPFKTCLLFFHIFVALSYISCVVGAIAVSARSSIHLVSASSFKASFGPGLTSMFSPRLQNGQCQAVRVGPLVQCVRV